MGSSSALIESPHRGGTVWREFPSLSDDLCRGVGQSGGGIPAPPGHDLLRRGSGPHHCRPLGIFITRSKKVSSVVIGIANVMQSIPCMALLAMGIPFLGVGETLAIFMVFVYAFLPILKNTYTGISSISPVSLEVARGIGLTRMQQLGRVELPMATPYIMSGIRIAAVGAVGTMTIAAFAGANGLGWFIMLGMNSLNYPMTVMGAVASAVMALTLDYLLGRVERALTSEGLLPQDQIKNLSKAVRTRRKAVAGGLCFALVAVSAASYAAIIA